MAACIIKLAGLCRVTELPIYVGLWLGYAVRCQYRHSVNMGGMEWDQGKTGHGTYLRMFLTGSD